MTQTEQIQKVKELQEKIKMVQIGMTETLISTDGSVKVSVNGTNQIVDLQILNQSNSGIEKTIIETVNQALQNVSKKVKQSIAELTQGLLPAGMSI